MSALGRNLLIGFLVFSVLIFAVALFVYEDRAIDSAVDAPANPADSLAFPPAPSTAHADDFPLKSYDLEKPVRSFSLPKKRREISGLTVLGGNRFLAHDDEKGVVFEIDYRNGEIVKAFELSDLRKPVADDFEGIAAAEGRIYLVSSAGRLYEFGEGTDGEAVLYTLYTTGIGRDYEIEGLAYDPDQRVLLLISKNPKGSKQEPLIAIYRWSLDTKQLVKEPILIPIRVFTVHISSRKFQPSGIERHPISGNYFIVAARQYAVAEISPQGKVLAVEKLAANRHPQAEGIAFASDNALVVSDEGVGKRATLTVYSVSKSQ